MTVQPKLQQVNKRDNNLNRIYNEQQIFSYMAGSPVALPDDADRAECPGSEDDSCGHCV